MLAKGPLHYAAKHGHLICIRLLLKHGADPNCRDIDGYAPLHYLCQVYNPGPDRHDNLRLCVKSLVRCGGDVRARTISGRRPLDIAQIQKNSVCEEEIRQQCMSCDFSYGEYRVWHCCLSTRSVSGYWWCVSPRAI